MRFVENRGYHHLSAALVEMERIWFDEKTFYGKTVWLEKKKYRNFILCKFFSSSELWNYVVVVVQGDQMLDDIIR